MAWDDIPAEEKFALAAGVIPFEYISEKYGLSDSYAERSAAFYQNFLKDLPEILQQLDTVDKHAKLKKVSPEFKLPNIPVPEYTGHIRFESDNVLVSSDWHFPYFNTKLWLGSLYLCRRFKLKDYCIVGDVFDNNHQGIKPRPTDLAFAYQPTLTQVYDEVVDTLGSTLCFTEDIYVCEGNHDKWFAKALNGQMSLSRFLRHDRVKTSTLQEMFCDTSHGPWRFDHPRNAPQNALAAPRAIAATTPEKHHHASGHTHQLALGKGKDGVWWSVEIGGMFRPECMGYLAVPSTRNAPTPGFMMLLNARPYIFAEDSDWEWWLDEEYKEYKEQVAHVENMLAPIVT